MDNFAYYLRSCGGTDEYAVEPLVRRWSATYDLVVRLLPDVALQADGVRSTNDAFRDEVEAILDRRAARTSSRPSASSRSAPRRSRAGSTGSRSLQRLATRRSGPRSSHPTSGADGALAPDRQRVLPGLGRRPRAPRPTSASAVTAPLVGVDRDREPGACPSSPSTSNVAVVAAVAGRRQARAASARTAPPAAPERRARRPGRRRPAPATSVRGPAPGRRGRDRQEVARRASASAGDGSVHGASRRAAGSAARGSGDDEQLEPDPAALAAQPPREVGRRLRDLRARGVGPERAQLGRDRLDRRRGAASRGSSRSMFIAKAPSATASSQRSSRPSTIARNASDVGRRPQPPARRRHRPARGPAAARRPRGGHGA